MKDIYKIVIVMHRETFIKYRYATSEKQAKLIGARLVAKQHGVLPVVVNTYLKDHPDCYKITKEIEFKEAENDEAGN
jgi:hypothetical protein